MFVGNVKLTLSNIKIVIEFLSYWRGKKKIFGKSLGMVIKRKVIIEIINRKRNIVGIFLCMIYFYFGNW